MSSYLDALELKYRLPEGLLGVIASNETGYMPNPDKAVSPAGAIGRFQLMPATAAQYGVNPRNSTESAYAAAQLLSSLLEKNGGDLGKALAGYNWGQGNVERKGMGSAPNETTKYIKTASTKMGKDPMDVFAASLGGKPVDDMDAFAASLGGKPATAEAPAVGAVDAAKMGAQRTFDRWAAGLRQATPEPVRKAVDWAGQKLGMAEPPSIDPAVQDAATKQYEAATAGHPLARFLGETAPALVAVNPLAMAGMAALEYGTPEERATRGALAFAGGKAGQYAGQALGRAFGPRVNAGVASDVGDFIADTGNKWGIPTTVGQTGSKPAQIAESVLANLPGSAGVIGKARDRTFQAFNQAVGDTFGGDKFGRQVTQLTPEILGEAKARAGGTIGQLAEKNTFIATQDFGNAMLGVKDRIASELVGEDAALASKWYEQIRKAISPDTLTMPGTTYKAFDSKLGQAAKGAKGTVADVLGDMRSALRNAMDKSISAEDAAKWATARRQYLNVKTVAEATKNLGTNGAEQLDHLSPARLLQAVNSAQKNAKFGSGNDLAELAQWAKATLPDKIPNSGTAQRLFYQKLLTNPLGVGAAMGGAAYGADQAGIDPRWALALGVPYMAARGLAGKPLSPATAEILKRGGGLLGLGTSAYLTQ